MEHRKPTGLGLGLRRSNNSHSGRETPWRSHGRSYSLRDPTNPYYPDFRKPADEESHSYTTYSEDAKLLLRESNHSRTGLDTTAAQVVGIVPGPGGVESATRASDSRIWSNSTSPERRLEGTSVGHLQSAQVPRTEESRLYPQISSHFPRADSFLRLDSTTTSKDLKKLLTTRVRHAPSSIDTNIANANGGSSSSSSPVRSHPGASHFEPERSRPRVEVYLALNNNTTIEGGYFSGTLTVRIRKPRRGEVRHIRIDGGKIRVIGFEGISETERYAFYQYAIPLSDASEDSSQLYESEPSEDGFRTVREGTHSLPFTIPIPHNDRSQPNKNVPKGVIRDNSINAEIKYILLASFKVRDDPDNTTAIDKHANLNGVSIAHFYRAVELWPTYGPMALHNHDEIHPTLGDIGTVSSRSAQGLLFGGSGMLHLTAVLHRKVWVAGQKCTVYIGAWNETKKFIKSLTLSIVRTTAIGRLNHRHESSSRKQIAETTLDAVRGPNFGSVTVKGWWPGVEPGGSSEFSHSIDIPADALTVLRTHIIGISYVLRVTLVTGSLSSNVSVDLPISIINAISTDGLPVPPPPGLLVGGLKLPKDVPVSFTFDTSNKYPQISLDTRKWNSSNEVPVKSGGLQSQEDLGWTERTSDGATTPDYLNSRGTDMDLIVRRRASQTCRDGKTLPELANTMTPGDSMSRLMSELEYDLNTPRQEFDHYSSQGYSTAGSSILKSQSTKHRVKFLTPRTSDLGATEGRTVPDNDTQTAPSNYNIVGLSKVLSSRRFASREDINISAKSNRYAPRTMDVWDDDDADEVLRSIPMATGRFDSTEGQDIMTSTNISGPITGSSMSSDPWSASGSSYSQPSASYQSSTFETSPEERPDFLYSRSYSMHPGLKVRTDLDSISMDDTPRAGSVARFQPEIVDGGVQTSSSRATVVPTSSSAMLARSLSAQVVRSPVNQYRRFSPQLIDVSRTGDQSSGIPIDVGDVCAVRARPASNGVATGQNGMAGSGTTRHPILPPPSNSTLAVVPDTKVHLRSRSGPQPRKDSSSNADVSGPDVPTKSMVRSRIAALEERSCSRPMSEYSSTSSTHSTIVRK
ncbi:arrestin [Ceratobasidium sp. AG-Ba]|nr:arrestin [Ceratobasidium sp. AG-Ba]